jgi:hypothetical protein
VCFAQGAHRLSQVLVKGNNVAANVGPYANIRVCVLNTSCNQLAPIFTDASMTIRATNPVIADGNGNYDYYVAVGCVDEQISTPGQGQKFVPNVCPFNGQAGGGGGGNVVGQLNRVGSFSNTTTTKPTNGTVDTPGNQFTYPALTINNNGTGTAPFTFNQQCSNPGQIAPGTGHRYTCNIWTGTASANPDVGQDIVGFTYQQVNWDVIGRGHNPGTNGAINNFLEHQGAGPEYVITTYQRGNNSGNDTQLNCIGGGDCQASNVNVLGYCNAVAGSDEGCAALRHEVQQLGPLSGLLTSGAGVGSTLIGTNINGYLSDQAYVYDNSAPAGAGTITSVPTYNANLNALTQTVTGITMTPSTAWGKMDPASVTYASGPVGMYQNPVSATANITLGTSPASPGSFTVGAMTCAGAQIEYMQITAVGVADPSTHIQSVTFNTRNGWDGSHGNINLASCFQGNLAGKGFIDTSVLGSLPTLYPILGATDASTMVFANCVDGNCNGSATGYILPSGTGITLFPYAEVIGTNGKTLGGAELGYNNVNWVNGHNVLEAMAVQGIIVGQHINMRAASLNAGNFQGLNGIVQQGSHGQLINDVGITPINTMWQAFNSRSASGNVFKNLALGVMGIQGVYQNDIIFHDTPISGGCIICTIGSNTGEGAAFTGSISGTVLTVSAMTSGFIIPGQDLVGSGIPVGCNISQYVAASGTLGGVGQYNLGNCGSFSLASQAMTSVKGIFSVFFVGVAGGASNISLNYDANTHNSVFDVAHSNGALTVVSNGFTVTAFSGVGNRCVTTTAGGVLGTTASNTPCGTVTGLTIPNWMTQSTTAGNITLGLPTFVGSGASHAPGIVPDPGSSAGTARYLNENGNWFDPLTGGFSGKCTAPQTPNFVRGIATGCS